MEALERLWGSIASYFIVKIPKIKNGLDCITTYVDRLSVKIHFIPSKHSTTTVDAPNSFFNNVFKQYCLPDSIVFDCDPQLTSKF